MGWPELLQALEAEAARESQALLARARVEADRVVAEARGAAEDLLADLRAREAEAAARARRAALAGLEAERTRSRLAEEHRLLEALRREALARALAEADEPLLARLIGEVLAWAPEGPLVLEVDPGDEASASAVPPSYMDALATSIPVSSQMAVWNSKMVWSTPWLRSGW